ncbi:N-acetylglucosamine kinase [Fulvivirgaceae bacterium BMA10]|uniref:N-acetylglucosamine kinase n=1 Tax=Splendidivirga corallicola TaxID=3051826 RepID=A0ABT8KT64_9BACT|nr:N-acetylglucosamine kinase [Fulvivirgaceae bacterium BMA10]
MKLIADSGSTKTEWRIIRSNGQIQQAKTIGFNPFYQEPEAIVEEIKSNLLPSIHDPVQSIFFYGAGCSGKDQIKIVQNAFSEIFPEATIEVYTDILAAARGLCNNESGIACILGTGANSCLYDGEKILENIQPLGFFLGDEGSGAYLGKKFIAAYLRNELPPLIMEKANLRYQLKREDVLQKIHKGSFPNRYLASFTKFLFDHRKDTSIYTILYEAFDLFFEKNVMKYENHSQYKVHFVGGVAYYFGDILRQVASDKKVTVRNILENPIAGLTLFHQENG